MIDPAPFNDPSLDAGEVIDLALRDHAEQAVLACSFGGPSGMVVLDMLLARSAQVPVYYLDTDLLFPETYALIERVKTRYGIEPLAVRPALTLAEQAERYGDALWTRDPDLCCTVRKIEPHAQFLRGRRVWLTGLRQDQSPSRAKTPPAVWDERFGVIRLSPLARWTQERTMAYVREHDVPYNELNDRGFPSVGCVPCTRAVQPGEGPRAGRWPGFAKTECGLQQLDGVAS